MTRPNASPKPNPPNPRLLDGKGIGMKLRTIKTLPVKDGGEEITQGVLDLGIEKDTEINGIGMGVLSFTKCAQVH